jgi:hypothetical protein
MQRKEKTSMKKLVLKVAVALAMIAATAQLLPADAGNKPIPPRVNRGGPAR